jgi:hypothetical protein
MLGGKFIFASISLTAVGKRFISTYKTNQPIPVVGKKFQASCVKKRKNKSIKSLETITALKKSPTKNIYVGIENALLIERENKLNS